MSGTQYLHGAELLEIDSGPRPIRTVNSAVLGIIGTAPNADPIKFPLNTPVILAGSRREAAALRDAAGLDGGGTLPEAVDAILDQAGALLVVVRVAKETTDAGTLVNVLGTSSESTGVYAFETAESITGYKPRVLLAPGFTSATVDAQTPNQVVAALDGIARTLRAVVIADGPGTDETAAINVAKLYGSSRVYVVEPGVKRTNAQGQITVQPASSIIAGLIAQTDNELGFWCSHSNKPIKNILGTSRPIDFSLGSTTCRANLLNENNVATIIRSPDGGFVPWGNRSTSADPKWAFLSVRRTADMINDSILRAHMWAVDRNITKTYIQDVLEGINAYLRELKKEGAIIDGKAWADPSLNTPDQIAQGKVFFDFAFTPPYAAEHIVFRSQLTNEFLVEIF